MIYPRTSSEFQLVRNLIHTNLQDSNLDKLQAVDSTHAKNQTLSRLLFICEVWKENRFWLFPRNSKVEKSKQSSAIYTTMIK